MTIGFTDNIEHFLNMDSAKFNLEEKPRKRLEIHCSLCFTNNITLCASDGINSWSCGIDGPVEERLK